MKHVTSAIATIVFFALLAVPFTATHAEEKATPQEVYELILKAVPVIESLGEAGLEAFKDPKGEFVYKDTYVLVLDCAGMVLAAHPNNKLIGLDLKKNLDKNPDPAKRKNHDQEICVTGKNPNGGWVEYYWEKLGESTPSRKISFALQVPGTDYTLVAGIYDENTSVDELNKMVK
jgi:cytochrome c